MRVIVDANIAAAALIRPDGWTARQLDRADVVWLAPSHLFDELHAHVEDYAAKAEVETEVLNKRIGRFEERVESVPGPDLVGAADHPLVEQAEKTDPDDAPYLAALVASEADLLWTRDGALLDAFKGLAVQVVPESG